MINTKTDTFPKKKAEGETHSLLNNHEFRFFRLPMVLCLCRVRHFLHCQPMDRLPKKEVIQKTKKTKVEKPKSHLLNPENLYKITNISFQGSIMGKKIYVKKKDLLF